MSIINSLKTFSKKAFNVDATGSNIDEVLDDMTSKVTPGSGGGSGDSGITVFKINVDPSKTAKDNTMQPVEYMEIDASFKDIIAATKTSVVRFIRKIENSENDSIDFVVAYIDTFFQLDPPNDSITQLNIISLTDNSHPHFYVTNENEKPTTNIPESYEATAN